MDEFKKKIEGYRKGGKTCPCCRETQSKDRSRKLARKRLKNEDAAMYENEYVDGELAYAVTDGTS